MAGGQSMKSIRCALGLHDMDQRSEFVWQCNRCKKFFFKNAIMKFEITTTKAEECIRIDSMRNF